MSETLLAIFVPAAATVLSYLLVDRLKARADMKRASGDSSEANTRANLALLNPLTERVEKLEDKVDALEQLNFDYLVGIKRLLRQLIGAKLTPVWVPKEIDLDSVELTPESN